MLRVILSWSCRHVNVCSLYILEHVLYGFMLNIQFLHLKLDFIALKSSEGLAAQSIEQYCTYGGARKL